MVRILLDMVVPERHESFVQRIGIHLLNCLCCQVEGQEKKLVGDLQAIKVCTCKVSAVQEQITTFLFMRKVVSQQNLGEIEGLLK